MKTSGSFGGRSTAGDPFSLTDVQPEELAAQITIIVLPIFKSITRDELTGGSSGAPHSGQWRGQLVCPNVCAMKRQFNQLGYWVVGQILAPESPRQRAELVSYFIKTAKRLHQLNNLHSANAIVSALSSSSIYRLERTWHNLNKKYPKDRAQLEKLQELFSDNNNYEALRKHLADCDLPCIPYLGLYSRDMIYIQEAYHDREIQRTKCISKLLDSLEKFQTSVYDDLVPLPDVQYLILSSRYLEELQKFVEDANYRRSLELEAPQAQHVNFYISHINDHRNTVKQINSSQDHNNNIHKNKDRNSVADTGKQSHNLMSGNHENHNYHKSLDKTQINSEPISSENHNSPIHSGTKRSNMLSGLTSIVHSAVVSTSNRFSSASPSKSCITNRQPNHLPSDRYLIDDSPINLDVSRRAVSYSS